MKRWVKGLTAAGVAALLTVPAFAAFSDVPENAWYDGRESSVTSGLPLYRANEVMGVEDFSDYESVLKNHWAVRDNNIPILLSQGGIKGTSDGNGGVKFDPDRSITTAEILSLILEAANQNLVDDTKAWPDRTKPA